MLNTHSEFTDEGILGNPDLKLYFPRRVHSIGHTACDDSGGIPTVHSWVDVKAVDVPVILNKYRRHILHIQKKTEKKRKGEKKAQLMSLADDQLVKDQMVM